MKDRDIEIVKYQDKLKGYKQEIKDLVKLLRISESSRRET